MAPTALALAWIRSLPAVARCAPLLHLPFLTSLLMFILFRIAPNPTWQVLRNFVASVSVRVVGCPSDEHAESSSMSKNHRFFSQISSHKSWFKKNHTESYQPSSIIRSSGHHLYCCREIWSPIPSISNVVDLVDLEGGCRSSHGHHGHGTTLLVQEYSKGCQCPLLCLSLVSDSERTVW